MYDPRHAVPQTISWRLVACLVAITMMRLPLSLWAEDDAPPRWEYEPKLLQPFWRGDTVWGESVLFITDERTGQARASVLFPILEVLSVRNSAGNVTFEAGRDYVWEAKSRELVLPPNSRIPARTPAELRRPAGSQKYRLTHRDGNGEIFFGAKLEYADMQTCITYRHGPLTTEWPIPKFDPGALPRTVAKLKAQEPLSIVVLGDSISAGANSSQLGAAPPYQPAYPELLPIHWQALFGSTIQLHNLSVGGTSTDWGLAQTDKVVALHPDLVILAFGMNDSAGRSADAYRTNIDKMVSQIETALPNAEFILVATMLANRGWVRLQHDLFPQYREALASLRKPGVALADLTSIWTNFLKLRQDWDQSGNGVNHPNDFGHRVYAQVISALLIEPSSQ